VITRRCRSDRSTRGFTLIEVLVAFAVATLLMAALYQVFSVGLRASSTAETYANAVLLAQSSLETLAGAPVAAGDRSDRVGQYERRISIRARPDLLRAGAQPLVTPFEVEVRVAWREGVREREIALSTVRLGPLR
jgi:general secretion pathway protein I